MEQLKISLLFLSIWVVGNMTATTTSENPTASLLRVNLIVADHGRKSAPIANPLSGMYFGMGFDPTIRQKIREEQEEFKRRHGTFRPPSACPGKRPYIFYCDPRDRTGPINPATGRPWPNGIYFPFFPPTLKTTTLSPTSTSLPMTLPGSPGLIPCSSLLCPQNGNQGYYWYSGLADVEIPKRKSDTARCGSLLCAHVNQSAKT